MPAVITDIHKQKYSDFYVANTYPGLESMDPDKTEFKRINRLTGAQDGIRKIVLDTAKRSSIPIEDRPVYVAKEHFGSILYHKTILDAIMSAEPRGISFTSVE